MIVASAYGTRHGVEGLADTIVSTFGNMVEKSGGDVTSASVAPGIVFRKNDM